MRKRVLLIPLLLIFPALAAAEKAHEYMTAAAVVAPPATPSPTPLADANQDLHLFPPNTDPNPIEHPDLGPKGKPGDAAPLGYNSPKLAPGQDDFKPVKAPPPQPLPKGPPPGATLAYAADSSIPKGWVACDETHLAQACTEGFKPVVAPAATPLPPNPVKQADTKTAYIVKLPENGSLDDLNKLLDDAARARTEGYPQ